MRAGLTLIALAMMAATAAASPQEQLPEFGFSVANAKQKKAAEVRSIRGIVGDENGAVVKGGFSYRAKKELGDLEGWQKGFADHRIRDAIDYRVHATYVRQNPARKHLCERPEENPYSSARGGFGLDDVPQGLKPSSSNDHYGAPFQSQVPKHPSPAVVRTSSEVRTSWLCKVNDQRTTTDSSCLDATTSPRF